MTAAVEERKPNAFVLSPIDTEYTEIYSQLIKPTLEQEGFVVARADELDLQNILAAIVHGISQADLVVAEISSRNPNVMYELGIAHALGKPTVILTQDIDQVPFDLRSYRLIKYSPHFAAIGGLIDSLKSIARAVQDGTIKYSSPVQDFFDKDSHESLGAPSSLVHIEEDEPAGLLDHLIENQDRLENLSNGTIAVSTATREIGERFVTRTAEVQDLQTAASPGHTAKALAVLRRAAKDLDWYKEELDTYDELLGLVAPAISESLMDIFELAPLEDPSDRESAQKLMENLEGLSQGLDGGLTGIRSMRTTLQELRDQRLNRDFSRSARNATQVMDSIIDRLSSFQSDLIRGASVLRERLGVGLPAS